MNKDFIGVVLGGDMNSYALARAFYEEYHIKTIIIGKTPLYPTSHSKLTECYYCESLLEDESLIKMLKLVNNKYPNKSKILFGNTDYYVKHIIHNRREINKISDSFIIPITSEEKFNQLFSKSTFYELCKEYGLNYPECTIFDFKLDDIDKYKVSFKYPIFIKPSDTVIYSKYNFEGKQKGYKIDSRDELNKVLSLIKASGFNDKFIIQEYIEGNDDTMFVYTAYVSSRGKVKSITAGKILMHDRTPELIGNYNAITSAYNEELSLKLKCFLEKINFTGICHFDIQYDVKSKKYYVFEMNIRQGRSNFYTLASGVNLARLVVDDYIYDKDEDFFIANNDFTVSIVPKFLLKHSLKKNNQSIKIKNFKRFTLASYDINLIRYYYQALWDYKILKGYSKYN